MTGTFHLQPLGPKRSTELSSSVFISVFVIMPILIGGAIYTLWRSRTLLVFALYRWVGLEPAIMALRKDVGPFRHLVPGVLLFSLPDALWVYAFTALLGYIWSKQPTCWERKLWTLLPVSLGLGGEFGQGLHLIPGTFDWCDVAAYLAAWFAAFISVSVFLNSGTQSWVGTKTNESKA